MAIEETPHERTTVGRESATATTFSSLLPLSNGCSEQPGGDNTHTHQQMRATLGEYCIAYSSVPHTPTRTPRDPLTFFILSSLSSTQHPLACRPQVVDANRLHTRPRKHRVVGGKHIQHELHHDRLRRRFLDHRRGPSSTVHDPRSSTNHQMRRWPSVSWRRVSGRRASPEAEPERNQVDRQGDR